ncbi:MAG: metal-dependent transcriptional regulator [Promethearchaeota archaeon]
MTEDLFSESFQEYLETIYRILTSKENKEVWITNAEIAENLKIKPPSVTEMLDKLQKKGLLTWQKRKGVKLTDKGKTLGKKILDLHFLLERFFTIVLEIDDDDLKHRLACSLEHHLASEPRLVDAMRRAIDKLSEK